VTSVIDWPYFCSIGIEEVYKFSSVLTVFSRIVLIAVTRLTSLLYTVIRYAIHKSSILLFLLSTRSLACFFQNSSSDSFYKFVTLFDGSIPRLLILCSQRSRNSYGILRPGGGAGNGLLGSTERDLEDLEGE